MTKDFTVSLVGHTFQRFSTPPYVSCRKNTCPSSSRRSFSRSICNCCVTMSADHHPCILLAG